MGDQKKLVQKCATTQLLGENEKTVKRKLDMAKLEASAELEKEEIRLQVLQKSRAEADNIPKTPESIKTPENKQEIDELIEEAKLKIESLKKIKQRPSLLPSVKDSVTELEVKGNAIFEFPGDECENDTLMETYSRQGSDCKRIGREVKNFLIHGLFSALGQERLKDLDNSDRLQDDDCYVGFPTMTSNHVYLEIFYIRTIQVMLKKTAIFFGVNERELVTRKILDDCQQKCK